MERNYFQGRELVEAAAVCCLLEDCSSATASGTMPDPSLYTDPRYKAIVETVAGMLTRHEPVDSVTITADLIQREQFESIGGWQFISSMMDLKALPAMFRDYQRALFEIIDREAADLIVAQMQERLDGGADAYATISESMTALQGHNKTAALLREAKPIRDVLLRAMTRYEKLVNGESAGIPTGFLAIDNLGGLQPGEMVLVTGQTGVGKSTLALNILHSALKKGIKCAVFSLEMSDGAWLDRLISLDLSIDRRAFRSKEFFTQRVLEKLVANTTKLNSMPLWLCDDPTIGIAQIRRVLARLAAAVNVQLFIVDYAQLVAPVEGVESREQQVAGIGRGIRAICQELGLVGLVLSQLNDDGKVRESRALLQETHLCLNLASDPEGMLWVTAPKGREVSIKQFPVDFDALTCRITTKSQIDREDIPSPRHKN